MNKTALEDIQRTLNVIRNQIDAVDAETKWAALELMLASSSSVVALAKKMAKPATKTVTRTISVPKTKVFKQPAQQTANQTTTKNTEPTSNAPILPQKPLSNQRSNQ
jgi:hypothetical protein